LAGSGETRSLVLVSFELVDWSSANKWQSGKQKTQHERHNCATPFRSEKSPLRQHLAWAFKQFGLFVCVQLVSYKLQLAIFLNACKTPTATTTATTKAPPGATTKHGRQA